MKVSTMHMCVARFTITAMFFVLYTWNWGESRRFVDWLLDEETVS